MEGSNQCIELRAWKFPERRTYLTKTDDSIRPRAATRFALYAAVLAIVVVPVISMFFRVEHVILSIFAGVLLATLLHALSSAVSEKLRMPHGVSLGLIGLAFLVFAGGLAWTLTPTVANELENLAERLPEALERLEASIREYTVGERLLSAASSAEDGGGALVGAAGSATSALAGVARLFLYFAVVLFIGIYVAASPDVYVSGAMRLLPPSKRSGAKQLLRELGATLRWWMVGRFSSIAVVGLLTASGLAILGIPGGIALGILAGVLSFIPNVGPVLSLAPAALVASSQGGRLVAYVVLLYLGVQFVESYFITPLIQQRAVQLPPALTLTAQLLMGVLFGFLGLLLATPLLAIVLVLVRRVYVEGVLGDELAPLHEHAA